MAEEKPVPKGLEPLVQDFCAVRRSIWSRTSRAKHGRDLARFIRWLGENDLPTTVESLDTATVGRYQDDLSERPAMRKGWRGRGSRITPERRTDDPRERMSVNTVTSYMAPLRSFCAWLVEEEEIARSPFSPGKRRVRLLTVEGELKAASRDELARLEAGTNGTAPLLVRDRAIFKLLRWTALRADELCGLQLEDVDLERGIVRVLEGKGRTKREVPLPEPAIPDVARYLRRGRSRLVARHGVRGFEDIPKKDPGWFFLSRSNGRGAGRQRMAPNTIGQVLTDAYHRAGGVGPSGPHGLRHYRAAELVAGGMPLLTLMRILGHTNVTTTQRYVRSISIEDLCDAVERADGVVQDSRSRRSA